MNYFSGVDHVSLDQGASLLTSNRLSFTMDSQSRIKGITYVVVVIFLYFYFIFYWLLVAVMYRKGQ